MKQNTIDFQYAFHDPHTLTLCRPSASEKLVTEVSESGIKFFRSSRNLKDIHPLSWVVLPQDIQFAMSISVDGHAAPLTKWHRHESGAPMLFAEGSDTGVSYAISAIAAKRGVIVKTTVSNAGVRRCAHAEVVFSVPVFQVVSGFEAFSGKIAYFIAVKPEIRKLFNR